MKKSIISILIFASLLVSCAPQDGGTPVETDMPTEILSEDVIHTETESVTELSTEEPEEKTPSEVLETFPKTTVDGEEYRLINTDILLDKNKTVYITTNKTPEDSNLKITSAFSRIGYIETFGQFFDDEVIIKVDDTELTVVLVRDGESDEITYYTKSVTAHGRNVVLATDELPGAYAGCFDKTLRTSSTLSIISDDDVTFYISTGAATGNQKGYMFTDTGIGKINDFKSPDHAASHYTFNYDESGRISYTRTPDKYFAAHQYLGYVLQYCVARDELAYEEGYVTFDTGIAVYHPEKTNTVDELFDLEKCYSEYKVLAWENSGNMVYNESEGYYQFGGIPLFDTLDELLAYNSARYPRAE